MSEKQENVRLNLVRRLKREIDMIESILDKSDNSDLTNMAEQVLSKELAAALRELGSYEDYVLVGKVSVVENGIAHEGLSNYFKSNQSKNEFKVSQASLSGDHLTLDIETKKRKWGA